MTATLPWPFPLLIFCGALYLVRCVVVVLLALLRTRRG